jgi:Ca2+-dependent lipid-binding protein
MILFIMWSCSDVCFLLFSLSCRGSSDPLIKAKIKGFKTLQTKHINKTLEPVW